MSGDRHRITINAEGRCGTCRKPVGTAVIKTNKPCRCDVGADYAICSGGHLVAFFRHYPERKP